MKPVKLSARSIKNRFDVITKLFPADAPGGLAMDVGMITAELRDKQKTINGIEKTIVEKFCARDADNKPIAIRTATKEGIQIVVKPDAPGYAEAEVQQGSMYVADENSVDYRKDLDEALDKEYEFNCAEVFAADVRALPKLHPAVAEALLPFISYAPAEPAKK